MASNFLVYHGTSVLDCTSHYNMPSPRRVLIYHIWYGTHTRGRRPPRQAGGDRQAIRRAGAEIRRHKAEIAQIDGTIRLFSPDVKQATREVTWFARSAPFVTGELSRHMQTALREADGRAITADEIAVQAMREKGLDMGDGALRADTTRRFLWTLKRLLGRGAVTKEGLGCSG